MANIVLSLDRRGRPVHAAIKCLPGDESEEMTELAGQIRTMIRKRDRVVVVADGPHRIEVRNV